jgi:hypothetical protein
MKKIAGLTIFIFFGFLTGARSQDRKAIVADSIPFEQIYLHFDQPLYVAGETMRFKAYLYAIWVSPYYSTTLYVDLLSRENKVVCSSRFPIDGSVSSGSITLPDSIPQGAYLCRAYTRWSLNYGDRNIFRKGIMIFNPANEAKSKTVEVKPACRFYPEGGAAIYNIDNTFAFTLSGISTRNRLRATIVDSAGHDITRIAVDSNGRGLFHLIPRKGDIYQLKIQDQVGKTMYFPLPPFLADGIALHVSSGEGKKVFTIFKNADASSLYDSLSIFACMFGRKVAHLGLNMGTETQVTGAFRTDILPAGNLQILVYDKAGNLIATRNTYVLNGSSLSPELKADTFSFAARSLNVFYLNFPDSIEGEFSLSVTTAANVDETDGGNIRTDLFLNGQRQDLESRLNDPAEDDPNELQMLTQQWKPDTASVITRFEDPNYICISGDLGIKMEEFNSPPSSISFIVSTKDSSQTLFASPLDKEGRFNLTGLVFSDTANFYYQVQAKKPITRIVKVRLDDPDALSLVVPSLPTEAAYLAALEEKMSTLEVLPEFAKAVRKTYDQQKVHDAEGLMLAEVKVEAKKVKPAVLVNKQYTSGVFSTMSNVKTIDLINNPDGAGALNIFEYLKGKIAGLTIGRNASGYYIESSRSLSSLDVIQGGNGLVDGQIYLNEMPVPAEVVANISVNQVALVKFFPPGSLMALPGVGIGCVLAIWTKEGEAIKDNRVYMGMFKYPGYSPLKPFIAPDYSIEKKEIRDGRRTLLWMPDIYLQGEKQIPVRFYNAENPGGYRIVLEGITSDGRLVHFEKLLR